MCDLFLGILFTKCLYSNARSISGDNRRFLEDVVGAEFNNHCHVDKTKRNGKGKFAVCTGCPQKIGNQCLIDKFTQDVTSFQNAPLS